MGIRGVRVGLLWLAGALVAGSTPAEEVIRVGGTGASAGIMERLGEAYAARKPVVRLAVAHNLGTGGGYLALAQGKLDIAVGSRPPRAEEGSARLTVEALARSPFVIAVQRRNAADSTTLALLERYFSGAEQAWPDGTRIRIVLRPADDSDTALLRNFSPGFSGALDQALARPGMLMGPSDSDAADLLERTPGALGATTLGLILAENRALKGLALDGKRPTLEGIAKGSYPHVKTLYLAMPEESSAATKEFVAFLRSAAGAATLRKYGFLPAAR